MADYLIEVAGGALWQWDTGRKIKIQTWENRSVTEAHFSIVGSDQALVLDVYEENGEMFSNIPNILLQQEEKIRIYLVDNNRTVGAHTESIVPRTKPDDYVYTETEIKNYEALEKKIPTKMSQLEQDVELGSKAFIINVTGSGTEDDPYTSDKTFEEIKQAYDDGKELKCIANVLYAYLDSEIEHSVTEKLQFVGVMQDAYRFRGAFPQGFAEILIGSSEVHVEINPLTSHFLSKDNVLKYTPTEDYHPATKKYVDDAVKGSLEHGKTKRELVATIISFTKHTNNDDGYVISYGDFILPDDVELNLDGNDESDDFEVEFNYNVSGYISRVVVKRNEFSLYKNTSGIYSFLIEKMPPTINISPYTTKSTVNSTMHCGISFGRSFDGSNPILSGFVWSDLSTNLGIVKVYKITK